MQSRGGPRSGVPQDTACERQHRWRVVGASLPFSLACRSPPPCPLLPEALTGNHPWDFSPHQDSDRLAPALSSLLPLPPSMGVRPMGWPNRSVSPRPCPASLPRPKLCQPKSAGRFLEKLPLFLPLLEGRCDGWTAEPPTPALGLEAGRLSLT